MTSAPFIHFSATDISYLKEMHVTVPGAQPVESYDAGTLHEDCRLAAITQSDAQKIGRAFGFAVLLALIGFAILAEWRC